MTTSTTTGLASALDAISKMSKPELDAVVGATRRRASALRSSAKAEALTILDIGDRVELRGLRPKYLNGATGTVSALGASNISVELDVDVDPRATARFGRVARIPAACLIAVAR